MNIIDFEKYKLVPITANSPSDIVDDLDTVIGGRFRKGELYVIGGAPVMGKTSMAFDIALRECERGRNVMFLSEYNINYNSYIWDTFNNVWNDKESSGLISEIIKWDWQENIPIWFFNIMSMTKGQNDIFWSIENKVHETKSEVLIIDGIESILLDDCKVNNNKCREISLRLLRMARLLSITILVTCSTDLSSCEKPRTELHISDIANVFCLDKIADCIILICRPFYYGICDGHNVEKAIDIRVVKNTRNIYGSGHICLVPQTSALRLKNILKMKRNSLPIEYDLP